MTYLSRLLLFRFTHVINLEFYTELVAILGHLLSDSAVSARSRLLCARAALAVLSGAGDALNVDPARFHHYLYEHMLDTTAGKSVLIVSPSSKIQHDCITFGLH